MTMEPSQFDDSRPYLDDAPTVAPDAAPFVITEAPPLPPVAPTGGRDLRRIAFIGVGILAAIALIAGIALAANHQANATSPLGIAQSYCQAAKTQSYSKAYGYFTPGLQGQLTQAAYPPAAQAEDAARGTVTACSFSKVATSQDSKSATLTATVTRAKAGALPYAWQFTQSAGAWRLAQAPDDALMPFATTLRYCSDIQTNQLDTAYQLLSGNEQQTVGQVGTFKTDMQQMQQFAGKFSGCHLQKLTLAKDGKSATVGLAMDFANFKNVPAQFVVLSAATSAPPQIDAATLKVVNMDVPFPVPVSELQQLLQGLGASSGS